ncbi:MAG: extracellular solute-binding protein [Thermomicrobiales bacterium]
MKELKLDRSVSRRNVLKTAAVAPIAAKFAAPAVISAQGGPEISHMVYSSLLLDRDTLQRVPPDTTDNVIEYFDWSVEEFKKVEPDITVNLEYLPHDESWFAKIDSSLIAGIPPDVVQGPISELAKYVPLGALSPIDAYLTEEDIADLHPAVLEEGTFNGSSYLWPWRLSFGGGIQINKTLWDANGAGELLPTGENRRWPMENALEAFKRTTLESGDQYGVVLMTDIHYHVTQFLFGFGARLFNEDETEVILNSPEGVAGLEWVVALEKEHGVAIPGSAVRKATEADQLFLERRAATYPSQGAGVKPAALDGVDDFEWFWAPPPNVEGAEPAVMTNIHGHYVFDSGDDERTAAAQKWTQFLTRTEAVALSLDQFGMPPARTSLWGDVTDENQKVGLTFTDMMVSFGRRASAAPITFSLAPRMLEAAFSGQKTPQQALDDFAAESNQLIQEAIADEQG